jgi:hypothetical protein
MTQKLRDEGEKPQRKVSSLNQKDRAMGGGIRQYATFGGMVVIIILLVVLIFRGGQPPQPTAPTTVTATNTPTPPEVATIQALETNAALVVTASLDPNVVALQTQNAILIQNATNQVGTSQATLSRPTETPQPTATQEIKIVTTTPLPTQPPTALPPTSQPTLVPPTQVVSTPQNASVQSAIVSCSDGRTLTVPFSGQVFKATVNGVNGDNDYVVIYDPSQSGASDIPANGWWYQPCLPAHRVAHEVALTVIPGIYRFIGPECQVWQNTDGNHPFDQGTSLVSRQNVQRLTVPPTKGNESWLFVRCQTSDSSGFSFAKLP